jgi:hypothetical protein
VDSLAELFVEPSATWSPYEIDIGDLRAFLDSRGALSAIQYPYKESQDLRLRRVYYSSFCGLYVGGIIYPDTVVCGQGWWPNDILSETSPPHKTSALRDRPDYDPNARVDLQIEQELTDVDFWYNHIDEVSGDTTPGLDISIRQNIIATRKSFLKRAIIVDTWVKNTGDHVIGQPTIGINLTAPGAYNELISRVRVDHPEETGSVCGFMPTAPGIIAGKLDSLNLVWIADEDGDASATRGKFGPSNPTAVIGLRLLHSPPGSHISFNWWTNSWGPRTPATTAKDGRYGAWPMSDRAFYRRMTNGEIDYDQVYAGFDFSADGWEPPPPSASMLKGISNGAPDVETFLSLGQLPNPLRPGDSVHVVYSLVMGADFHQDPNHFKNTYSYLNPAPYLNGLNFTNLISAAQWAGWFFDNPGVDTDGDGYAGEFYLVDCNGRDCDSVYYSGDGVPDFKGPLPPPPPDDITFETYPTKIIARWTGKATEFARDRHMRRPDWEGYNVYLAVDDTVKGWSLVGSWDRQDYVRYSYHGVKETWIRNSQPHTIEEWKQILSDPEFDPRDHSMPSFSTAYFDIATDTVRTAAGTIVDIVTHDRWSYFGHEAADHQNEFEDGGRMHPNPIRQIGTVDTLIDGEIKQYGIYEYTIDDLSQSKVYWLTVSAFDYGDYRNFIDPEESVPGENAVRFVPVNSADVVVDSGLRVNVHPNPYKAEFYDNHGNLATYHSQGYEYSPNGKFDERDRRIWFTNLPDTAVIEIYSLDGDLIRIIRHPDDFLTKYQSVVGWDLISRNTQAVVAGIYIWKVTSRLGSQVGKLVIIK